jgi:hypothetical protein
LSILASAKFARLGNGQAAPTSPFDNDEPLRRKTPAMLTPFTFPNEPVEPTRRENNPLFHSTSLDNVGHRPRNQAVVISPGVFPLLTYTKKDILENIHQNQRNWVDELAGAGGNIAAILPFAAGASYFAANPAFADDVRAFLKDLDIGPVRPPPRDDTPTDVRRAQLLVTARR